MRLRKDSKIEILTIGSELLTPYFQETNSQYLTQRLNDLGMEVSFKSVVGDDRENLLRAINEALSRSQIIIATGGLGPTKDDRTREAFAEALHRKLLFHKNILKKIEERFKRRGLSMPAVNRKQAYIIEGAAALKNKNGTAPGIWLEKEQQIIGLLPGPPHELKPMFEESVWPRLQKLSRFHVFRKVIKTASLTESQTETFITKLYPEDSSLQISTLACPGQIEIHLTARSEKSLAQAKNRVSRLEKKILERLKDHVFSSNGEELEEVVGRLLRSQKKTLAVAESCTGGLLGDRITNVPGSSYYFLQGIVAYSNQAKIDALGVKPAILIQQGAVSSEVAQAMARGIREKAESHYGLGITGIAGPSGGSPQKPVGLVYIALAWENGIEVVKNRFLGNREKIKFQASQIALDMLRERLQKKHKS
ncbi:MAG: competence/damage-inducible protein A [Candidatus Aminicenantes bacterium]|nr:competence/damage-inducible protein A [Candidatus Aminicenantes bacterium]